MPWEGHDKTGELRMAAFLVTMVLDGFLAQKHKESWVDL